LPAANSNPFDEVLTTALSRLPFKRQLQPYGRCSYDRVFEATFGQVAPPAKPFEDLVRDGPPLLMAAFVLDTSIAREMVFWKTRSDCAYSLAILKAITDDYRPAVLWLWYYEIANTILTQVRRKTDCF